MIDELISPHRPPLHHKTVCNTGFVPIAEPSTPHKVFSISVVRASLAFIALDESRIRIRIPIHHHHHHGQILKFIRDDDRLEKAALKEDAKKNRSVNTNMMTVRFCRPRALSGPLCGKIKRMFKLRIRFYEFSNKIKMKREKREKSFLKSTASAVSHLFSSNFFFYSLKQMPIWPFKKQNNNCKAFARHNVRSIAMWERARTLSFQTV